jgi:hypothetical protein
MRGYKTLPGLLNGLLLAGTGVDRSSEFSFEDCAWLLPDYSPTIFGAKILNILT